MPPVGSPPWTKIQATSRPSPPPTTATNNDSASTSASTVASEKPSVFSTASSLVRSRTACAIVLPTTSRIVKSTATRMAIMIEPMSPICLANPSMKPFSVVVLVSACELANMSSKVLASAIDCCGILDLDDVPADQPLALPAVLVEVVVAEEELRLVDARLAVVDADDVELPGRAAALRLPDRRLDRHAIADLPAEPLGQILADDDALAILEPRLHLLARAACIPCRSP